VAGAIGGFEEAASGIEPLCRALQALA
jgi:hypothetical protein